MLLHHYLACVAIGVAHDNGTAALFIAEFISAQVVAVDDVGDVLPHFRVFHACGQSDNLVFIPRRTVLIEGLGSFVHHIDGLQGRFAKDC